MYKVLSVLVCMLLQNAVKQPVPECSPWLATLEEYYDGGQPQKLKKEFQPMRKALRSIDSLIKANPNFNSIQQGRFRSTIVVANERIRDAGERIIQNARLNVKVYMKDGWDEKCGLIPQADRIASDRAGISIGFNESGFGYTSLDNFPSKDDKLNAFAEPVSTKKIGGYRLYYFSKVLFFLSMTYNDELPWEPVTTDEYLGFIERRFLRSIEDNEREKKQKANTVRNEWTPKEIKEFYDGLKKLNQAKADQWLKDMEQLKKDLLVYAKKDSIRQAEYDKHLQEELEEFRRYRSSLSPEQLKKQAVRGGGKYSQYSDEHPTLKDPLVKMKDEFLQDGDSKGQIKMICFWFTGRYLDWDSHIQKTMETLDYSFIKSLMKK